MPGAGDLLVVAAVVGKKMPVFRLGKFAEGAERRIGDELNDGVRRLIVRFDGERKIVLSVVFDHLGALVDPVAGALVGNVLGGNAVPHLVDEILDGVIPRDGEDRERIPLGFEPVLHLHAHHAVGTRIIDPEKVFDLVPIFVRRDEGVRVDGAVIAAARGKACGDVGVLLMPRSVDRGIEECVLRIVMRVVLAVVCVHVLLSYAFGIGEIEHIEGPLGAVGDGCVHQIVPVALVFSVCGGVRIGRCAEIHDVALVILIVHDLGCPYRRPCRARDLVVALADVQRTADGLPIHEIFGARRIHGVLGAVKVIVAAARRVVQNEGIGAVHLVIVAVEELLFVQGISELVVGLPVIVRKFIPRERGVFIAGTPDRPRHTADREHCRYCQVDFFHSFLLKIFLHAISHEPT